jgi:hypothetical protein
MTAHLNLQPPATTLMPSPSGASEPRNEAEVQIQQLIDEALASGQPVPYEDAASFVQALRSQSQLRQQGRSR